MEKKTIGAFIVALRKAKGMTQQEVADRLNISNKAVSRWERDECAPDVSIIPALAEMFGVTCDELLKGERIFAEPQQEKSEPKVEKQLKALINRSVSSFKTLMWVSLALSVVGFVCMLGISYGFFRPIIGFAVMMLFAVAAFAIGAVGVNKMKEAKRENELFENADTSLINRYNKALGGFSYIAFCAVISVIAFSVPFLFFLSSYVDSVLTFESYIKYFCLIALVLVLIFLALKDLYCSWITEQPYENTAKNKNPKLRKMNILQLGALVLANILYLIRLYFLFRTEEIVGIMLYVAVIAFILVSIGLFIVFVTKYISDRKAFVFDGVRNLLMLIPTIFIGRVGVVCTTHFGETTVGTEEGVIENPEFKIFEYVNTEYIWIALGSALLILAVFKLIKALKYKKG